MRDFDIGRVRLTETSMDKERQRQRDILERETGRKTERDTREDRL